MATDCLFCKIAGGEVPAEVVHRTERVVAFRDVAPVAPTHVLVIPVAHHRNAAEVAAADPEALVELVDVAARVATEQGLENGYRLVFNTGADANQTVFHAHLHLIGGRAMEWPPG